MLSVSTAFTIPLESLGRKETEEQQEEEEEEETHRAGSGD
jgi:hypothetical protein